MNRHRWQQAGAMLLSVVGLLLGLMSFALWVTSSLLNSEIQVQQKAIDFDLALHRLLNEMRYLTASLQTAENSPALTGRFSNALVDVDEYIGRGDHLVRVYSITLDSPTLGMAITQQFVQYSALLQLPNHTNIHTHDPQLLSYLFNRSLSTFSAHYFASALIANSCNNVTDSPVLWVRGNCNISGERSLGSAEDPVLVIIENGHLSIEDDGQLFGLVVIVSKDDNLFYPSVTLSPSSTLHGAIGATVPLNPKVEGKITFDTNILQQLQRAPALSKIHPIPGSWHDFN